MIVARDISKQYQIRGATVPVLDHLDLDIERGEFVAVMGRSGEGKSTLLHLLGCLDSASDGQYLLDGQDLALCDDKSLARIRNDKIGFVFQSNEFVPYLNLAENVCLPGLYRKPGADVDLERARTILEQVGLTGRWNHRSGQLSGGECQRAAVARALYNQPSVLLADEPTGNLDTQNSQQLIDLFRELNGDGLTILMVTHDAGIASRCHRKLTLENGKLH